MLIGLLQVHLLVHGSESLKDKRRVIKSVKDRLHREHMVSIAEVAQHDILNSAVLGLALVGHDGKHIGETLDRISTKLRQLHDAEVASITRRVIDAADVGLEADLAADEGPDEDALAKEMLAYMDEATGDAAHHPNEHEAREEHRGDREKERSQR